MQNMNDHKPMIESTQVVIIMQEAAYQCVKEMRRCKVRKTYEILLLPVCSYTDDDSFHFNNCVAKSVLTCMNAIVINVM